MKQPRIWKDKLSFRLYLDWATFSFNEREKTTTKSPPSSELFLPAGQEIVVSGTQKFKEPAIKDWQSFESNPHS